MIAASAWAQQPAAHHWAIVLHGGAGTIERASMKPATEAAYRASLAQATEAGAQVLDRGGSSLDAVEAAIRILEDDPLFNAGRGSDFAADGRNEMDAAIMDGSNLKAGAVGDVTRTRHPISLARAVMEKSPHVFLVGEGADAFSVYAGLEQADPSFFFTERRWQVLVRRVEEGRPAHSAAARRRASSACCTRSRDRIARCAQVWNRGRGGSRSGRQPGRGNFHGWNQGKRWGRVGDSPLIGAGTYASNQSCAVSATGTGEYFIRLTVARTVCALVRVQGAMHCRPRSTR